MTKEIVPNNLYSKIAGLLQTARQTVVRTVNRTMVYTYYEIGRMIVEDEQQGKQRAEYGKQVLKELSTRLTADFGKGFSVENLDRVRFFYQIYSKSISSTALTKSENSGADISSISQKSSAKFQHPHFQLSWSHYLKLMRIENHDERSFYEIECVTNNWSLKELQRQFDTALYERLALSRDKDAVRRLALQGQIVAKPEDAIKEPYILEFLGLQARSAYSETELEEAIIDKIQHFLKELGKGFMFASRQERISFDERHFYIDLVFYNRILRCFVIIDLKIGDLKHQDLGQMQMYVNYYDRYVKLPDENKTVGIVLCHDKSETLVEITLPEDNDQIFASRYQTVLPNKEELKRLLSDKDFEV
jgi:predicted nuclease of restriction endonuclease-like (RecB) superfamily